MGKVRPVPIAWFEPANSVALLVLIIPQTSAVSTPLQTTGCPAAAAALPLKLEFIVLAVAPAMINSAPPFDCARPAAGSPATAELLFNWQALSVRDPVRTKIAPPSRSE